MNQSRPWAPVSLLKVVLKDKNFQPRWCSKSLYEKRRLEGWIPVSYKELSEISSITMLDGESLDTTIQRRNLILCKMPKSRVEERNAYYANMTKNAFSEEIKSLNEDVSVRGYKSGAIGKIEIVEGSKVGG